MQFTQGHQCQLSFFVSLLQLLLKPQGDTRHQRISGPLLDRIDIHCEVPLVDFRELSSNAATGEKSEIIR